MTSARPGSITLRLTLLFSAAFAAVFLATGFVIAYAVERHFEQQDFDELMGKADLVRYLLGRAHTEPEIETQAHTLADAIVGHRELAMAVVTPDGRALLLSPGATFPEWLYDSPVSPAAATPGNLRTWSRDGAHYRGIAVSVASGVAQLPPFTAAVSLNIVTHERFMVMFRRISWALLGFGILVSAVLGWIVAHQGLVPLRRMAGIATSITANRLNDRLPVESTPAELADLARSFNTMLSRLEDSFRRLSEFSADLAHEMRTPVSNLMTQTQVVLSTPRTAEEYREILHSNLEEFDYLAHMIADMLFLAKADSRLLVPDREAVDLGAEVHRLFDYFEAFAEDRGVVLRSSGNAVTHGNRLMLRRTLGNLLSNAIRHTPRGGAVSVELDSPRAGATVIRVENPGPDIPPGHLPYIFDRFYRVAPARRQQGDGAGLGLAIAKACVEAHGGTISAVSGGGITRFEIALPTTQHATPRPT